MTRFEKTDLIASVIFRKLPSTNSRQAQGSHRLASLNDRTISVEQRQAA